jgi:hypothetical protein
MKRIFVALALANALLLGGCADESEQITGQELGKKFQRGVSGEGQLGPMDRTDDPYVRQQVPQTHP